MLNHGINKIHSRSHRIESTISGLVLDLRVRIELGSWDDVTSLDAVYRLMLLLVLLVPALEGLRGDATRRSNTKTPISHDKKWKSPFQSSNLRQTLQKLASPTESNFSYFRLC